MKERFSDARSQPRVTMKIAKPLSLVLLCALCAPGIAPAQSYPSAAVKVVVPYGPGGGTDNIARALGERLARKWNQPVVIENRPGAEAVVGTELIARSPADGYTLGFVAPGHTLNPSTRAKLPYDTLRDFAPITMVAQTPFALAVSNDTPARNAQELAALAKAQPGKLAYASADASSRLAGEMFNQLAGVQILNVQYKSIANAITDLVGGHVQIGYASLSSLLPHHASGKVKLLAISGTERSPLAPTCRRWRKRAGDRGDLGVVRPVRTRRHAGGGRREDSAGRCADLCGS